MAKGPQSLKIKVWEAQGRLCYWCGFETVIHDHVDGQQVPDNAATIDHVYPVWHPKRIAYKAKQTPSPFVIACKSCNNKRGGISFAEYHKRIGKPFVEPRVPRETDVRRVSSNVRIRGFGKGRRR